MSDCMYNSDYLCGVNPKGGCWNCDQFKNLDKFIVGESEYVKERSGDICIDGVVFRRLAENYIKNFISKKQFLQFLKDQKEKKYSAETILQHLKNGWKEII